MMRIPCMKNIAYQYVKSHKKEVVKMPTKIPPKYVYEIKYHPLGLPTLDQGFLDHVEFNKWDQKVFSDFELFRYKYSGHWWHVGGLLPKIITLLFPVIMYIYMVEYNQEKARKGLPSIQNSTLSSDIMFLNSYPPFKI